MGREMHKTGVRVEFPVGLARLAGTFFGGRRYSGRSFARVAARSFGGGGRVNSRAGAGPVDRLGLFRPS